MPTVFILFVTVFIFYKAFNEKKYWLCLILFLVLCESFVDYFYLDIKYNIFLLTLIEGRTGKKTIYGESVIKENYDEPQNEIINIGGEQK